MVFFGGGGWGVLETICFLLGPQKGRPKKVGPKRSGSKWRTLFGWREAKQKPATCRVLSSEIHPHTYANWD